MEQQIPISPDARADDPQADDARGDGTHEVAPDLAYQRLAIVNVAFYGLPGAGDRQWVLIDAGLPGTADRIAKAAAERFGPDARPAAIVMTHAALRPQRRAGGAGRPLGRAGLRARTGAALSERPRRLPPA